MPRSRTPTSETKHKSHASLRSKLKARLAHVPTSFLFLVLPAGLFSLIFMIIPLIVVLYRSLQPSILIEDQDQGLTLANFVYFLSRPHYVRTIFRTLRFAFTATFFSVAIGYGASLVLRRVSGSLGNTAILVLTFPILSGPIVTIMGWMIMLTSGGAIGQSLALARSILGMEEASTLLLGTDVAVILGMVHFNLAFVIMNLLNVMLVIPHDLEEAAMNLGANRWQVFRQIIWPLSLPGVFSATLISLALSMNAFVNPTYLGNDSRPVMTTQISQFMLTSYNWQMASTTSVILLSISMVIILLYNLLFSRAAVIRKGSN